MAECGMVGDNFDEQAAYSQSFGRLPSKTIIHQMNLKSIVTGKPTFQFDMRNALNKAYEQGQTNLKAHTTTAGGAGTAGFGMIPIFVDPQIVDETRKNTPIVEMIPRVTNLGMFADFNNLTAKGGGFTASEDASLTEQDNTYDRNSTAIKFLYAVGRVTGPSQSAQPSYILMGMQPGTGAVSPFSDVAAPNSMQTEVLVQTRAIRELEENLIVNGNASSSGISGNADGTEFSGFVTLQGTTNKVDKNTTAIDLTDVTAAIKLAFDDGGRPEVAWCSSGVFSDLLDLLSAKIGFLQAATETQWGFSAIKLNTMVGGIPVVPSMFMSNVSGSKAIYFMQLAQNTEMRVLQDLTFEELAHTNDSRKFMLKIYETLIIRNIAFNAFIGEIA